MMMVLVVVVVVVMMTVARAQFRQFQDDREQQGQADIPQAFFGYRHDGVRRDAVDASVFEVVRCTGRHKSARTGRSTRTDVTRRNDHHRRDPLLSATGTRVNTMWTYAEKNTIG